MSSRAPRGVGRRLLGLEVLDHPRRELLHAARLTIACKVNLDNLWHAILSFATRSEIWLRLLEPSGINRNPVDLTRPRFPRGLVVDKLRVAGQDGSGFRSCSMTALQSPPGNWDGPSRIRCGGFSRCGSPPLSGRAKDRARETPGKNYCEFADLPTAPAPAEAAAEQYEYGDENDPLSGCHGSSFLLRAETNLTPA
jgi:hypothetical protein